MYVPFVCTHQCEEAFEQLKDLMTRAPLLAHPDFSRNFLLETDASGEGLGAVLAQKLENGTVHPIVFASRTLQLHERNYGATELEALGSSGQSNISAHTSTATNVKSLLIKL